MHVRVKLFAQYREGRFKEAMLEYPEGTCAKTIIEDLGIDESIYPLGVLMLNGRHKPEDIVLNEGDTLSLFPKVGGG